MPVAAGVQHDVGDHLVDRQHEALQFVTGEPGGAQSLDELVPDRRDLLGAERAIKEKRQPSTCVHGSLGRLRRRSCSHVMT
jgi:hypothetical protein